MKKCMKRFIPVLIGLFTLFACDTDHSGDTNNHSKVPVEIMVVETGDIVKSIQYNGDIRAESEVKVFSKIPDRIERYFVEQGDTVGKGDVIARILATTIEQGLRQAEAGLLAVRAQAANMEVEFERAKRLNRESVMSDQQFDLIKTQYEATMAQVKQAEAAVLSTKSHYRDATVTAPIQGIIAKKYYENGDMANLATPLVKIVQMDRVKIMVDVTEEDLGRVAVGQEAHITVRSFMNRVFQGTVRKISPVLDPVTRMAEIEILVDNRDGKLKPGMYADVEIITGILDNVIIVPRHATIESNTMESSEGKDHVVTNFYVYKVSDGIARQIKLDVQYINHRHIAVHSILSVGDTLVVSGQNNLRDGMGVSIVSERGEM